MLQGNAQSLEFTTTIATNTTTIITIIVIVNHHILDMINGYVVLFCNEFPIGDGIQDMSNTSVVIITQVILLPI